MGDPSPQAASFLAGSVQLWILRPVVIRGLAIVQALAHLNLLGSEHENAARPSTLYVCHASNM